jgi:polysaccharide biosynthesis/export protein
MKLRSVLDVSLLGIVLISPLSVMLCTGQDAPSPAGDGDRPVGQPSDHPALQRRNPRYKLCVGDSFDLTFPLTPEFNQIGSANGSVAGTLTGAVGGVIIQPDGYVSLVGVGDIYAAGKTIPELTENIQTAYSKILHDPVVNITLKDFEKPYFMALGQVGKPGKYDLRGETTLTQGVALAGGFTPKGAKTSQVLLFRQVSDDWLEVRKIDVKKMLNGKDLREDVHLRPGDMIFVPTSLYAKVEEYIPKANLGLYVPIGQ